MSVSAGAAATLNHAEVTSLVFGRDRVGGATVSDRFTQRVVEVNAKSVVNATGPRTDAISRIESPSSRPAVLGTKAEHIAVPADRVGNREAVTMLAHADQRVMFVLPGGTHTIIGTTDTETHERPDQVRATRGDVQYLLDGVNAYFPDAKLTTEDVVCAWAGIRPLIASGNSGDPAGASREHAITIGPRGVIAVTGGKLTTYRSMSEEVVDRVQSYLGRTRTLAHTATRALPGSIARPAEGDDVEGVGDAPLVPGLPYTIRDVADAVDHEFACTIGDVLIRRTHLAFETRDHGVSVAARGARLFGERESDGTRVGRRTRAGELSGRDRTALHDRALALRAGLRASPGES